MSALRGPWEGRFSLESAADGVENKRKSRHIRLQTVLVVEVSLTCSEPETAARGHLADDLPTWSAPDRFVVGRHSVLPVRQLSLLVPQPRAKLLLQSRRASEGGTCEDM